MAGFAFDGVVAVAVSQFWRIEMDGGGLSYALDSMLIQAWIKGESPMELHTAQVM